MASPTPASDAAEQPRLPAHPSNQRARQALLTLAGGEAAEDLSLAPSQLVIRSSGSPPGHTRP